jgi:FAD/FMN-containing dehydrogenase
VEPFLPNILSHTGSPSAYPPDRSIAYSPFNIFFAWDDAQYDDFFYDAADESARRIEAVAKAEGQNLEGAERYPNYATYDTPLKEMYGDNVKGLRKLKERVDPKNVMGLAGGFRF